jgi:peroxiredoxin
MLRREFLAVGTAALLAALLVGSAWAAAEDQWAAALGIVKPKDPLPAERFAARDLDGRMVRLDEYRGKVLFLTFWATWCGPCRQEMPAMDALHRALASRDFVLLAVNYLEGTEVVRRFVREVQITFPILLDPSGSVAARYGVRGLPASVFIDRQQMVVGRAIGPREWASPESRSYFDALLARP